MQRIPTASNRISSLRTKVRTSMRNGLGREKTGAALEVTETALNVASAFVESSNVPGINGALKVASLIVQLAQVGVNSKTYVFRQLTTCCRRPIRTAMTVKAS